MVIEAVNICKTAALVKQCVRATVCLRLCVKTFACSLFSSSSCACNVRKKKKQRVANIGASCSNKTDRGWQFMPHGSKMFYSGQQQLPLMVMSYNVLAQDLLENHRYLYSECKEEHLTWETRWKRIVEEIVDADPDIICLQEVQDSHFEPFFKKELSRLGYEGLYKRRTGARVDGVGLWYRSTLLQVQVWSAVEFKVPGEQYLNRDNVAIVARLVPVTPKWQHWAIVVATTHLLYNTRRHDVKLAQTQLLLAECESLAYRSETARVGGPQYWPIIITGDFNLQPYSGVYKFLTKGRLEYEGLCAKTLATTSDGKRLGKDLISPAHNITDNCQYVHEILARLQNETGAPVQQCLAPTLEETLQKIFSTHPAAASHHCISNFSFCSMRRFGSGTLTHPLNLSSVYLHGKLRSENAEATTKQDGWCSVDYIFYSISPDGKSEGNLKLAARYRLFTRKEAQTVGPIPNNEHPSDHYPLMAHFVLTP